MITIEVKRIRMSVTQGEAAVYINGEKIIQFADNLEMVKPGVPYYGLKSGNWASTKPDSDFIHGLFNHSLDNMLHYSDKAYAAIKKHDAPS